MAIKLTSYKLDRRDLFRLTVIGAGGLYLTNLNALAADRHCEVLTSGSLSTAGEGFADSIKDPGDNKQKLFFFIDGVYTNFFLQKGNDDKKGPGLVTKMNGQEKLVKDMTSSELNSFRILTKARVAIHCEFPQTENSFVESVILSDENHRILAGRRLSPRDGLQITKETKVAPFVVFDRLNLKEGRPLFITYVINEKGTSTIFQYKIDGKDTGPSRLDFAHLPKRAQEQISQAFLEDVIGGKPDSNRDETIGSHSYLLAGADISTEEGRGAAIPDFPFDGRGGYIANAYFNQRPVPPHSVRARFKELQNSGDFSVEIEKMHADDSIAHYMRYFLVLDPVGRIIGGLKREFKGTGNPDGTSFTVESGLMEGADGGQFKLAPYKLNHLPYVQIITEDVLDAIGRISLRIR